MTDLDTVIRRMENLKDDGSVPSNVHDLLGRAIEALQNKEDELSVRKNTATGLLDEVSGDPNLAQHTRTEVWNIASMLESVEE
jgi:uncharacterized protein (UPF0147 family)